LILASCMKDKPDSLPTRLVWNPDLAFLLGYDSFGMNAASGFDTTLFELDINTGLPLWVDFDVVMTGRIPFDLASMTSSVEDLNQILFRINMYNGFPHDVLAQAYFVDIDMNEIDSMFSDGQITLKRGGIEGNGETIDPKVERQDAIFDRDRIAPLVAATEILFEAVIQNPEIDTTLIPYYPTYQIALDIGVMVDLTIEF
jgi:hypothetical protein